MPSTFASGRPFFSKATYMCLEHLRRKSTRILCRRCRFSFVPLHEIVGGLDLLQRRRLGEHQGILLPVPVGPVPVPARRYEPNTIVAVNMPFYDISPTFTDTRDHVLLASGTPEETRSLPVQSPLPSRYGWEWESQVDGCVPIGIGG